MFHLLRSCICRDVIRILASWCHSYSDIVILFVFWHRDVTHFLAELFWSNKSVGQRKNRRYTRTCRMQVIWNAFFNICSQETSLIQTAFMFTGAVNRPRTRDSFYNDITSGQQYASSAAWASRTSHFRTWSLWRRQQQQQRRMCGRRSVQRVLSVCQVDGERETVQRLLQRRHRRRHVLSADARQIETSANRMIVLYFSSQITIWSDHLRYDRIFEKGSTF